MRQIEYLKNSNSFELGEIVFNIRFTINQIERMKKILDK